mgnify:CR=1 FL=1
MKVLVKERQRVGANARGRAGKKDEERKNKSKRERKNHGAKLEQREYARACGASFVDSTAKKNEEISWREEPNEVTVATSAVDEEIRREREREAERGRERKLH